MDTTKTLRDGNLRSPLLHWRRCDDQQPPLSSGMIDSGGMRKRPRRSRRDQAGDATRRSVR